MTGLLKDDYRGMRVCAKHAQLIRVVTVWHEGPSSCRAAYFTCHITTAANAHTSRERRTDTHTVRTIRGGGLLARHSSWALRHYVKHAFYYRGATTMAPKQRMRIANEKATKNITLRGNVPKSSVSRSFFESPMQDVGCRSLLWRKLKKEKKRKERTSHVEICQTWKTCFPLKKKKWYIWTGDEVDKMRG